MRHLSLTVLTVLSLTACASSGGPPRRLVDPAAASARLPAPNGLPQTPRETLAEADRAYISRLGATRGGRFDTERQIQILTRAVELYTQFLERAAGHPELLPAVRKSEERRADARDTITFLEQSLRDGAQSP
ncbi:MAG: hypothetical protein K0R38_3728 [Polyangiaceae bacterium]|nr:hypothetical protein [Polyangiaceae bacterium]